MTTSQKAVALRTRHKRVRKKVVGTPDRPRLTVYRSNQHVYAQVIDDFAGRTVAAASTQQTNNGGDRTERAKAAGRELASKAKKAGVTRVTFDRGGFKYHGRVRALADGAREGGLEF
ncbi:MAG: 50S ribosomal protein L18 [Actinomycetota bacterium]|nr:50S ribosomal protein L18 [Actinomycetota bacterium]